MSEDKRIVDVDGVKIEIDLRTAKKVEHYKVGDSVKVLVKDYGSSYDTHVGVIVGFDEFEKLPTITVAYVKEEYSETKMLFKSINAKTEDVEIAPLQEYELSFDLNKAIASFDKQIFKAEQELASVEAKKKWFLANYETYFSNLINISE